MTEPHRAYLNVGSNIQPEINLVRAIELLHKQGDVAKISRAWESESVGANGPNYLNACVLFHSPHLQFELKENILRPIEAQLGRVRSQDKYAPRTLDIDIILFNDVLCNDKFWGYAYVIIPLAEIHPEYKNPATQESIIETARRLRQKTWIEARPEVLGQFSGISIKDQN